MAKIALDDLLAFSAIASRKSFRKAAIELGQSPSALSHIMQRLERELGVRLLNRTTRSVALTAAGEHLLVALTPALNDVTCALESLDRFRDGPSGRLRINTPEIGARLLMKHVVPEFLSRYPGTEVDLHVENRLVDIVAEGFDAGVRMGYSVPQDMIAVRFDAEDRFVTLAAPSYLERHGAPIVPLDLHDHVCIQNRLPSGKIYRWEFERGEEACIIDVKGALTMNHMQVMIEAAVAGLGIIYTLERAAGPQIRAGALVHVLEDWCPPVKGLSLYYAGHRQIPSNLRGFIDTMKELMPAAAKL